MNAIRNPELASVLQDFDSDRETARKRAVRATQRIVGVAFGALAVFLAWVIVADARDLASGAEARLVRINPSELERTDPQQEAIWHFAQLILVFPFFYLVYRLVPVLVPLFWWDLIERSAAGKTGGRPVGRF